VPFRETHHISGAAVKLAEDKGCELSELTVADLAGINPLFTDDVTEVRVTGPPQWMHISRTLPAPRACIP